jgi:hypothetical protein
MGDLWGPEARQLARMESAALKRGPRGFVPVGRFGCFEKRTELGIERKCRRCLDWWPLDQFAKSRHCYRGVTYQCKACTNERKRRDKSRYRRALEAARRELPRPVQASSSEAAGVGNGACP